MATRRRFQFHLVTLLLMTLLAGGFVAANLVQRNGVFVGQDVAVTGWPLWNRVEERGGLVVVHHTSNIAYDGMITGSDTWGDEHLMQMAEYLQARDKVESAFAKRVALDALIGFAATLLAGALAEFSLRRRARHISNRSTS